MLAQGKNSNTFKGLSPLPPQKRQSHRQASFHLVGYSRYGPGSSGAWCGGLPPTRKTAALNVSRGAEYIAMLNLLKRADRLSSQYTTEHI